MQKQAAVEQMKKPYTGPQLTEHGSVEAETQAINLGGSNQPLFKDVK